MVRAVLGPRPVALRPSRHLPESVDDVIPRHGGDLSRPLASEQDQLQGWDRASATGLDLSVGEMRSRLEVGLRSTPWHGLTATISCFTAQEKIAEAAARVWLATIGASIEAIISLTSERAIAVAFIFPQRGSRCRATSASACFQLLLCFLA